MDNLSAWPSISGWRLKMGLSVVCTILLSASAWARQPTTAPAETTPRTLPGAETHVYRHGEPEAMRLHVIKPDGWRAGDRRPAMMFFFGGGFNRGTPERSAGWARLAASWGMVGIAPDYRTRDRFNTTPAECVADARAALRWVQDHADELGIDPKRIVVGGSSAGGHLALWTAIEQTPAGSSPDEAPRFKPAALILFAAPSDIQNSPRAARFGDRAGPLSPLQNLDDRMPPVLAFHGDADVVVPYSDSVKLREKLVETGNSCELITVPGGSHNFTGDQPEWRAKAQATVRQFLHQHQIIGGN